MDVSPTSLAADHARFAEELEFVQQLGNPLYVHHLAAGGYFACSEFLDYLVVLEGYWATPAYKSRLTFPFAVVMLQALIGKLRIQHIAVSSGRGPEGGASQPPTDKRNQQQPALRFDPHVPAKSLVGGTADHWVTSQELLYSPHAVQLRRDMLRETYAASLAHQLAVIRR